MKWPVLFLFILAGPAIMAWLRTNPPRAHLAWSALSFLPFVIAPWHLSVAPYATPGWSGYVKGWEFSLLDAVAIGVLFGTRGPRPKLKFLLPFLAYFVAVFFALFQARFFNLALGYPLQLARVGLVLLAASRVAMMERGERAILVGLIAGITVQALYAIAARAGGALQTGGSLGHQNLLGFVSHMVLIPSFGMLLAGRWPKPALLGSIAGLIVVSLTASRATIAIAGAGLVLTLLISLVVRMTARKAAVGMLGILLLGLSAPLAYEALQRRAAVQNINLLDGDAERIAFETAAKAMLAAKPMGVGPNHYVFIANTEGYNERAGVNWAVGNRNANVHNSYLLVAAETGYLGLATMVLLLASSIWLAFSTAIKFRREPGAEVLIGVGVGLLAIVAHGFAEWMFLVFPVQYVFACSLGLIVGMRSRFLAKRERERRHQQMVRSLGSLTPAPSEGRLLPA
ncbi:MULTISPECIES: O-antigen ligase family protein [Sphingomonas]|uniref:O-antigen ligase family protein n=1 Tax=Sphingomonas TaxID=13687 RepID=UPI00126994EB|nr:MULTISPECIES: O-antigen ligase family protein [Sphingomonas]